MAFGQSTGPSASGRQLDELLELLEAAGHSGYRDARGPMGFNQRQAGGKFTSSEADEFIERLQTELHGDGPPAGSHAPPPARASRPAPKKVAARKVVDRVASPSPTRQPSTRRDLAEVSTEALAAELQRRGWVVLEP